MADQLDILRRLQKSLVEYGLGDAYQPVMKFLLVLASESDRGMVLAGAAFIDNALSELIESHFVDDSSIGKLLNGNAPLATFSSRIEIAFALGLLDTGIRRDIDLIRRIRNECAHTDQFIKLTNQGIQNRINELTCFCGFRSLIRKFEKNDGDFEILDDVESDPKLILLFNIGIILVYISDTQASTQHIPMRRGFLDEWVEMATAEFTKSG